MAASFQAKVQASAKERTHRDVVRFNLEWTIESFKSFQDQTEISSTGLTMKDLGPDVAKDYQGRWRIRITPCCKITEKSVETKYLSVHLWLTDGITESSPYKGEKICTDFHTSVTTGKAMDTVIFKSSAHCHVFSDKNVIWGYEKVVAHTRLFGAEKEPGLIQDDRITIVMDVLMYKKPKTEGMPEISKPHPVRLVREFTRRQLEWLRAEDHRQFSDLVLVSNDNKEFHIHRFTLMAHSPVFEAMFTHNLQEKQLSRCELKDVDGESVQLLLDYVYGCDTGKINSGNAEKMLIVADKYEMMDLRAACEHILASNIPVEKAVHFLVLAGELGLAKLKEAGLSVMPKNMGTVLKNGGLDEALQSDPNLLVTIMEYCADKMRVVEDVQQPREYVPPSQRMQERRLYQNVQEDGW